MIASLGIILLLASYSHGDTRPEALKLELKVIEDKLEAVLTKNESGSDLIEPFGHQIEEIKNRAEFHELMEVRSLRFLWQRIQYDMSTLRKRQNIPRMKSTMPIQFPLDDTVNLLVRIYSIVPNILPEDFPNWPKHTKNRILRSVRAFFLLKAARKLDDRPLHRYEQDMMKAIERVLKEGANHLEEDLDADKNLLPAVEPTDERVDAAFELFDGSSLFAEFISKLEDVEREVIKMMEGIVVVVQRNNCHVYSKVGKWYLANYPCNLW